MTIDEKIAMLRQMRYVAAQKATGGRNDEATALMIRAHAAIEALEAVKREGVPELYLKADIDGHPLDPEHSWNKPPVPLTPAQRDEQNARTYDRLLEINKGIV